MLIAFFGLLISGKSMAQLPTCIGPTLGYVYYLSGTDIYNFDPTLPFSASNPTLNTIVAPSGCNGLSVGPNLNAAGPTPTFYTTVGGNYYYYNGATWVNTGFSVGNAAAVNPGAGGPYIYNLVGSTGQIYVYNGSGTGSLLTTVNNNSGGGPYDVVADCAGDFYVLQCNTPGPAIREYNPAGTLINTITVIGAPNTASGGGMAIVNNHLYFVDGSGYYGGLITGSTVTVAAISGTFPGSPSDFASCPIGGVSTKTDTVYVCSGGAGTPLTGSGTGPYTWSVMSGPAVVTGSSQTVFVTAAANSVVLCTSSGSACGGGPATDTFRIIVPTATVNSGLPSFTSGCGVYVDTLNGFVSNTTPGLTYTYSWTPTLSITSGATSLHPVTHPVANTTYKLTVSTDAAHGGCAFIDSGLLTIIDKSVHANFTSSVNFGCTQDTVTLTNTSLAQTFQSWDFGDNTGSVQLSPTHIYNFQGTHSIKLTVTNGQCVDSVRKTVDPPHPIKASFTVSADTVCQNHSITFTNTSVGTNPKYWWSFGNGATDTNATTLYTYTHAGTYLVKLAETDFVPCHDTAKMYVIVDSVSYNYFTTSDSVLCQGKVVTFTGHYVTGYGNIGNKWDFGDGTVINNSNPIEHAYENAGTYPVSLTAKFRICPDTTYTKAIKVVNYPTLNVGADTAMCPNAAPILIGDNVNAGNKNARWLWNTGDTSAIIFANQPGVYYATVTVNGCSTSDSIWVKNDCYLSIPNTFTPNNDGVNDYFFPRQRLSAGVTTFKLDVYNRWGQLIFETRNIDGRGWDGKFNSIDQPEGVYIYLIDVQFKDGETETYKGNVTLLR